MSKLIINLKGGTGNQLFQTAAALSLAEIYKKECEFSISDISNNKYRRKLEISFLIDRLGLRENISKSDNKIIYLDEYDIDHPLYFSDLSPLSSLKEDIQVEGYFTNYRIHNQKVIKKIKNIIRSIDKIKKLDHTNLLAIHIRELHGTGSNSIKDNIDNLNINYYSKAINQIVNDKSDEGMINAIVFSDMWKNPESSKLLPLIKTLLKDKEINYINGDNLINTPLDIIKIFMLSKYCVISNSTLSWWGAYLSEGKIFSPVMNLWEPNLKIPDHWIQIYSGEIKPKTHHNQLAFELSIGNTKITNSKIYNQRRLLIIKFFRKISRTKNFLSIFSFFRKSIRSIGRLPENPNKTFI